MPLASTSPSPTDPGTRPAPATRDQVDAYRFGLRRMEAALVRGDPVLLHEQIRTQRRAVAAGVVLSVLGVVGALLTAHFAPRPTWQEQNLVVGAPSGALYAVAHDPDRLVPVANAVAGRLVLAALRSAAPVSEAPVLVDDAVLADAPRTAAAAVPGAVAADPGRRLAGPWAICDEVAAAPSGARLAGTTVLAGSAPEPSTDPDVGVLLAVPGGDTWLVAAGRRHRVDPRDAAVRTALGLAARAPRPASPGLVSALPEGVGLVTPQVPAAGAAGPPDVPGRVGDVLVSRPAGGAPRYHVVVAGGLQEVPPLVADVLAAASGDPVAEIGPEVVAAAAAVHPLDLAGWPATAPHLREPAEAPGTCWSWTGASPEGEIRIGRMPGAAPPVVLAGADGEGAALDAVAVGAGGTVRATAPGVAPGAGTLWVVSATGVAYGVADADSAAALGVTTVEPAPEAVLRLLPTGPALDLAAANRAVDVATAG